MSSLWTTTLGWFWGHAAEEALEEVLEYSDLEQRRISLELDARELELMERRLHLDIARLEFEAIAKRHCERRVVVPEDKHCRRSTGGEELVW